MYDLRKSTWALLSQPSPSSRDLRQNALAVNSNEILGFYRFCFTHLSNISDSRRWGESQTGQEFKEEDGEKGPSSSEGLHQSNYIEPVLSAYFLLLSQD
jgi:hypothetical protein